jgi:hypothetical protein
MMPVQELFLPRTALLVTALIQRLPNSVTSCLISRSFYHGIPHADMSFSSLQEEAELTKYCGTSLP